MTAQSARDDDDDVDGIARTFRLFKAADGIVELRVLAKSGRIKAGYFDNRQDFVDAVSDGFDNFYISLNSVDPRLLPRAANRLVDARAGSATSDRDVLRRHRLPFDLDPVRPAGISSTDAEHEAALERARAAAQWFVDDLGWPAPIVADSGNGGHLLFAVDEPNDDATRDLVQRVLEATAARFDDERVIVDRSVFNAARIVRLYGTLTVKGDSTPERPHRRSRILSAPTPLECVTRAQLEALAAHVPSTLVDASKKRIEPKGRPRGAALHFDAYITGALPTRRIVELPASSPFERRLDIECPFDAAHRGAAILELRDSHHAIFKCWHESCAGRTIRDVDALLGRTPAANGASADDGERVLKLIPASSVTLRERTYLNFPRYIRGELTWHEGDSGSGKTLATMSLIAAVTRGRDFLGESCERMRVVFLTCEDDVESTIVPMMSAAEVDLAMVSFLKIEDTDGNELTPDFSKDLSRIEAALRADGVGLFVIDGPSCF